jgi:hypothetical protein
MRSTSDKVRPSLKVARVDDNTDLPARDPRKPGVVASTYGCNHSRLGKLKVGSNGGAWTAGVSGCGRGGGEGNGGNDGWMGR